MSEQCHDQSFDHYDWSYHLMVPSATMMILRMMISIDASSSWVVSLQRSLLVVVVMEMVVDRSFSHGTHDVVWSNID